LKRAHTKRVNINESTTSCATARKNLKQKESREKKVTSKEKLHPCHRRRAVLWDLDGQASRKEERNLHGEQASY